MISPRTTAYKTPRLNPTKVSRLTAWLISKPYGLAGVVSLMIMIAVGILSWNGYQNKQDTIAQNKMYLAVYAFEEGNLEAALTGQQDCKGL